MRPVNPFRAWRDYRARTVTDLAEYWEQRARDLIHGYDHPETWADRGWMAGGIEEKVVPALLREHELSSVIVVGAGTGRQYDFLSDLAITVRGFDLSPTLVDAARMRHPEVPTVVDDLIGAEHRHASADAVLATAVLQHIPPDRIDDAVRAVTRLSRRMIVLREATWLAATSSYQWAHDYDRLFAGWTLVKSIVTDENDRCRIELRALVSPSQRE